MDGLRKLLETFAQEEEDKIPPIKQLTEYTTAST